MVHWREIEFRQNDSSVEIIENVIGIDLIARRAHSGTVEDNAENQYFIKNHLGSTVSLMDKDGVRAGPVFDYFPYGKQKIVAAAPEKIARTFTGKELDLFEKDEPDGEDGEGWYYFGARYFDADIGKWTSVDAATEFTDSYRYTVNPITHIDPNGLSDFYFMRDLGYIAVTDRNGIILGTFQASNNATGNEWAAGTYNYSYTVPHVGEGVDSRLGNVANLVFDVPGHTGMGVHSGRAYSADLAGRTGVDYATFGCIRTTDQAMQFFNDIVIDYLDDPIQTLTVIDDTQAWYNSRNSANAERTPGPRADSYVFDE